MPRIGTGSELYKYLNKVEKFVIQSGTIGDTTTSSSTAAGASTVAVTAITNFTAADPCFINGSGGTELVTIGTPALSMPVTRPVVIAQNSGARFVEMRSIDLGHIAESGVSFGGSLTLTPIKAATSRTAIAFFADAAELTWNIPLLGYNNLNLQAAFGATEGETGSGTQADPYAVQIGQATVGTQTLHGYRLTGVRQDGKNVEIDLMDCTVEVNVNVVVGSAQPDGITITGKCTNIIQRIW